MIKKYRRQWWHASRASRNFDRAFYLAVIVCAGLLGVYAAHQF